MIKFTKDDYNRLSLGDGNYIFEEPGIPGKKRGRQFVLKVKTFVKKPLPIKAAKMPKEFEVDTRGGVIKGAAGDYLIQGIEGELYPCEAGIFEKSYGDLYPCEKNSIPMTKIKNKASSKKGATI